MSTVSQGGTASPSHDRRSDYATSGGARAKAPTPTSKSMAAVDKKRLDFGDWFWLVWIGAFLAFEIPAAIWKREWTFSHHVWKWFDIDRTPTWWRWLALVGFLAGIALHFGAQWSAWYFALFIPLMAVSLIYYYRKEAIVKKPKTFVAKIVHRRPDLPPDEVEVAKAPYDPKKTAMTFVKTLGEILVAVVLAVLPQLPGLVIGVLEQTPAEALNVPPGWTTFWFLGVRVLSNWWKNR